MATPPRDRTGVLVVRAWTDGVPRTLRMRLTRTLDVTRGEEESDVAASVDEACAIVARWLEDFQRSVTGS